MSHYASYINRTGPVNSLGGVLAKSPPALKTSLSEGEGGGGSGAFFTVPESVLYFSVGLVVHGLLQVIPTKIVDKQKEEKIPNLLRVFARNFQNFARFCPNLA